MMEENSTTGADNSNGDGTSTAPAEGTQTSTENQTGASSTDNLDTSKSTDAPADGDKKPEDGGEGTTPPASKFDDDLDDWAEKTGRGKPETDRERQAFQDIRNSQREFSKSKETKKAGDALKGVTDELKPEDQDDENLDDTEKDIKELKADRAAERTARLQSEFFTANEVTEDTAKVMGDILKEKVERAKTPEAKKREFDYWTDPEHLEDWHSLAKARVGAGNVDTAALQDEAARKERERIEKESNAVGPSRGASQRAPEATSEQKRTESLLDRWSKPAK
jgi:hypothetical protein